ncbi:lipase [uncultured Clostridium sp.]|uniref:esterase/lipase family protein n=1 Tax=uncultured Clostridium sp. TaxID=59620 RepID=UPI0025D388F9|nr:lipase [uncultured Clostridium sp.]
MKKSLVTKSILAILMTSILVLPVSTSAATKYTDGNYGREDIVETKEDKILEESINEKSNTAGNKYPIIFVHGLMGWGGNELLGINYWGGFNSLHNILTKDGYEVYMPTISPVSSNWDRACELYAYLKGGTVDYGEAHSRKEGHARFGATYPGVLPKLGTYGEDGQVLKMHLFGHSMGGQTSRVLSELLENGVPEEVAATGEKTSPLFTGGKHWIESITTLCTPHDGSSEAAVQEKFEPYVHRFFAAMAAQAGFKDVNKVLRYSLKLDQWGVKQEPDESCMDYIKRVFKSNLWKETKDLSIWDLTPEGSEEINKWANNKDDIYYFSIACSDTHKSLIKGYQVPNINMNPLMLGSAFTIGHYTQSGAGKVLVDKTWWENDGLVSVVSAIGPHSGSTDRIVNYDGTPEKGEWNYLGKISNIDHLQVIFQNEPIYTKSLQNRYKNWCQMLWKLEG